MKHNPVKHNLYNSIKSLIENAKKQIVRNVNITMILTYYEYWKNDS